MWNIFTINHLERFVLLAETNETTAERRPGSLSAQLSAFLRHRVGFGRESAGLLHSTKTPQNGTRVCGCASADGGWSRQRFCQRQMGEPVKGKWKNDFQSVHPLQRCQRGKTFEWRGNILGVSGATGWDFIHKHDITNKTAGVLQAPNQMPHVGHPDGPFYTSGSQGQAQMEAEVAWATDHLSSLDELPIQHKYAAVAPEMGTTRNSRYNS